MLHHDNPHENFAVFRPFSLSTPRSVTDGCVSGMAVRTVPTSSGNATRSGTLRHREPKSFNPFEPYPPDQTAARQADDKVRRKAMNTPTAVNADNTYTIESVHGLKQIINVAKLGQHEKPIQTTEAKAK